MQSKVAKALSVVALVGSMSVVVASPASASSDDFHTLGCATLNKTYTSGGYNWAQLYNPCSGARSMRAVVNNYPDSSCITVAGYGYGTVRVGLFYEPNADGAADC